MTITFCCPCPCTEVRTAQAAAGVTWRRPEKENLARSLLSWSCACKFLSIFAIFFLLVKGKQWRLQNKVELFVISFACGQKKWEKCAPLQPPPPCLQQFDFYLRWLLRRAAWHSPFPWQAPVFLKMHLWVSAEKKTAPVSIRGITFGDKAKDVSSHYGAQWALNMWRRLSCLK